MDDGIYALSQRLNIVGVLTTPHHNQALGPRGAG
jgi:hypothetical protein